MSTPKKRSRAAKKPAKKPIWELAPLPDDAFGTAFDAPAPHGPEAPALTIDQRFEYLIYNPDLYAVARAVLPAKPPGSVGHPSAFPPYIYLVYLCAISVFRSARSTAAHLARPLWWEAVRTAVRELVGPQEADALPDRGPTRSQWNYHFQNHLKEALPEIRDARRDAWINQAIESGLMTETGRGSWIYPAREQVLHGDATVAHPPSDHTHSTIVDKETGEERHHRVGPDASVTTEGGGRKVYGNKFVSIAARCGNLPHSRVILALESVRHTKRARDPHHREDEGAAVVRLMKEIKRKAPGVRALTYDTALRGVHRAPLIAQGLVVFTMQHSGLDPHPVQKIQDGPCTHHLYAAAGRICERRFTVDGKTHYTPLPVSELEYRKGEEARFYHRISIPCPHKEHTLRIRVDGTKEDREIDPSTKRKRFNRTEHLRQVAPGNTAGNRLKGFRQDSESQHSRFDQSYPHERIPAYGAAAALLIYIGYAWASNSVARIANRRTP